MFEQTRLQGVKNKMGLKTTPNMMEVVSNKMVHTIEAESLEALGKKMNDWLKEDQGYIREMRPIAYMKTAKNSVIDTDKPDFYCSKYNNIFGIIILYEPKMKHNMYIPPKCKFCKASEDNRKGMWFDSKFYCNDCMIKKLQA